MLKLPELNKSDLNQLLADARKQLGTWHPRWTDHAPHDPGITMLELLAYLKLKQHQAMDRIGPAHERKFLELLDIKPEPPRCAAIEVFFTARGKKNYLPAGTKLRANSIIFETGERLAVSTNELTGIVPADGKAPEEFSFSKQKNNSSRELLPFGPAPETGTRFHLCFKEAFTTGEDLKFKIELLEDYPVKRNPVSDVDPFIPLVSLQWEYYGEEKGETGWHPLEVCDDTTRGLLFSGFLTFRLQGKHLPCPEPGHGPRDYYPFRCTLAAGTYDLPPRLKSVLLNCVPLYQQESLCRSYLFSRKETVQEWLLLDSYLAYFGKLSAYLRDGEHWVQLEESDFQIEKDREQKRCRLKLLKPLSGGGDDEVPALKVVAVDHHFTAKTILGSSSGFINQEFDLELQNVLEFSLMAGAELPEKGTVWSDWQWVGSREKASRDEKCFALEPSNGQVSFGDNRRGAVPPAGQDNLVITDCVVTKAGGGNIQAGNIQGFAVHDAEFERMGLCQILPATGGKQGESLNRAGQRMLKELKTGRRAVSIDNFVRLAHGVPGLLIEHVKVLPLYQPGLEGYPDHKADNCVTLVVEPYSVSGQGKLTTAYKENMLRHLEKFRLVTTKIYVIEPAYVGLEIYGELMVKANYGNAGAMIREALENYIERMQRGQHLQVRLGQQDIYGVADLLDCVSAIRHLYVEPIGRRVYKNSSGDIVIPADSKFFLKRCDLILTTSDEL